MSTIPDFTESELWTVRSALRERYGRPIDPELAESEIRRDPDARELTTCPALYWKEQGCAFLIMKTAAQVFRCQFFYSVREQYGTGIEEFDDLGDCVLTLLRVQADHESRRQGTFPAGGSAPDAT